VSIAGPVLGIRGIDIHSFLPRVDKIFELPNASDEAAEYRLL
jgi:hypothetical protein